MTNLFRTPAAIPVDSFLVTIFDTTASMWREFDIMKNTHESVFQDYPKKQNFYMTKECVEEFKQFSLGAAGDITNAFIVALSKIENEPQKYGKNITILFVSDGWEVFDENKVKQKAQDLINKGYNFQFICIAVGDEFDCDIILALRSAIHSIDKSATILKRDIIRPKYIGGRIPRDSAYREQMIKEGKTYLEENFRSVYKEVKGYLKISVSTFETDQLVQNTAMGPKTNRVVANSIVSSNHSQVKAGRQFLERVEKPDEVFEFIHKSTSELIEQNASPKAFQGLKEICNAICDKHQNIVQQHQKDYRNFQLIDNIITKFSKQDSSWGNQLNAEKKKMLMMMHDLKVNVPVSIKDDQLSINFQLQQFPEQNYQQKQQDPKQCGYVVKLFLKMMRYYPEKEFVGIVKSSYEVVVSDDKVTQFEKINQLLELVFENNTQYFLLQKYSEKISEVRQRVEDGHYGKLPEIEFKERNSVILGLEEVILDVKFEGIPSDATKQQSNEIKKRVKQQMIKMLEDDD